MLLGLSSFSSYSALALCVIVSTFILSSQNLDIKATPNDPDVTRLNGRIISLQFADNGSASWIVSGKWRVDINYDINGVIPKSILNLNVSLNMISNDGLVTKRYELSNFKVGNISYDKQTHLCTMNGTLKMSTGSQSADIMSGSLKLFERKIITISLDPSKTKTYFGVTPIYGIVR